MGYVGKIGLDRDCVPTGPGSELMESAGRMDKWCRACAGTEKNVISKGSLETLAQAMATRGEGRPHLLPDLQP